MYNEVRSGHPAKSMEGKSCRRHFLCSKDPDYDGESFPPLTDVSEDEVSQDVPRRKNFGALFARRRSAVVAEMVCSSERDSRASSTLILQLEPQPVSSEVSEDTEYHERDFESIQPARRISADNRKVLKSRVFDQSSESHPDSVQITLPPPCSPATPRQPAITPPPPCSPATPRISTIPP